MSITRPTIHIVDNFSILPNAWVRDKQISRKARGLLAELMSHRPGWEVTLEQLVNAGPEGRDSIRAGIKELVDAGYLRVVRTRDEGGHLQGTDYIIQDPATAGNPIAGNPTQAEPTQADPQERRLSLEEENLEEDQGLFEPPTRGAKLAPRRSGKVRTAVPDNFPISAEMKSWAASNAPSVAGSLEFETKKFLARNKAEGKTYIDWTAAWRNWMLKAHEWAPTRYGKAENGGVPNLHPSDNGRRLGINYAEPETDDAVSTSTR